MAKKKGAGLGLWCLSPLNNISVISWWSVLLLEETGVPGKNHRDLPQITLKRVHLALNGIRTHNFSGAIIAQVDVNPTTILSRPRRPKRKGQQHKL
jgi:hypothetical protein